MDTMVNVQFLIDEITFVAVRSRGPGGQNVNKVSSAALLFWNFDESPFLSAEQKMRIREKLKNSINSENQIYLRSDEFRDLERNKIRCLEKLQDMLNVALHRPKARKATRPTYSSKLRKRETKSRRSDTKKTRQKLRY